MKKFKRILAIGAHFDDVEINCGGFLAKLSSQTKVVVAGNGHYCNLSGKLIRSRRLALAEGRLALSRLGIKSSNLLCLNYPETEVPYDKNIILKLEKIINDFSPEVILTHWPCDTHQDHSNLAQAVVAASRYQPNLLMWEPIFPSGKNPIVPFVPQLYIDISNFQSIKIKALQAHQSQIKKFSNCKIDWIEGITARARYRGYESSCKYAEAFYVFRLKDL